MVRGRRVKAIISPRSEGKSCLPKLKNRAYKKFVTSPYKNEHCITEYFKVECFQAKPVKDKSGIVDIECEDILSPIRDAVHVEGPLTPHRIQLNTESEELKDESQTGKRTEIKQGTKGKLNNKDRNQEIIDHKLTDYYPVRRSIRKTKQAVLEEQQETLRALLKNGAEDGLKVQCFDGKGRGVVAIKPFNRGDFVVEYSGELLDMAQARKREEFYSQDLNTGCYMYYFKFQNQQYCVDATAETGRLGRLVNHSRNGNLITRAVEVDGLPHLVLIAKEYIKIGDEICYDYGDRSKEALKHHPWLAS